MKQSEKLDLLLKGLYEKKNEHHSLLSEIAKTYSIEISSRDELFRLAERLEQDGYIRKPIYTSSIYCAISSLGIEYCEEDSYAFKGSPVINNTYISVEGSSSTQIVTQSKDTKINSKGDLKLDLDNLLSLICNNTELSHKNRDEIASKIKIIINKL